MIKISKRKNNLEVFKKHTIAVNIICIILFLIVCFGFYKSFIEKIDTSHIINDVGDTVVGELIENTQVIQTFKFHEDMNKISIKLATYQNEMGGYLQIYLLNCNTNEILQKWQIDNTTILDNQYYELNLENIDYTNNNDTYALVIEGTSTCSSGSSPTIWQSSSDSYEEGELYINGEISEGDLAFKTFYKTEVVTVMFWVTIILFICLFIFVNIMFTKKKSIEIIFVGCMLILGILYMSVFPPFSAPDEPRHLVSAYSISNYIMGTNPAAENGFVYIKEKDISPTYVIYPNYKSYEYIYNNFFSNEKNEEMIYWQGATIVSAPFWVYLPQALGITIGRIFDCGGVVTIFLGRLCSLLFYIGIVYQAIKIIPFGKMILFAISLLPMTLELISSYSYDAIIIPLALLFIAVMCRLIFEKENLTIKDVIIPAVIIAFLAPNKYVYIPLIMLTLLLPKEKYKMSKEKILSIGIVFLAVLIGLVLGEFCKLETINYMGDYRTLEYCIINLKETIYVFFNAIWSNMSFYLSSMVGMYLGWLEIQMPQEVFALCIIMLLLSTIETESKVNIYKIQEKHCIVFSTTFLCVFALTLLAMLLAWTSKTSYNIDGVQGRYFLPVLPLILLCFKKMNIYVKKVIDKFLIYIGMGVNFICILRSLMIISSR